ncbi:TetR/AcrR family transcriptional regulator [Rhodoferax sp. UBA5149]|uniref:TetR/AcrR family transcriptional regulator n=1 Tax=Rhodoferax sp. UBA5149 TaxID=1947379 RepID=UPI0025DF8F41|nr:TetR/AcrR family transcriptional regulator [Rhodoferax sp. UBA5149]
MPYPKHHAAKTREKILACAYKLFIARGFDATSIDRIMRDCQLTRGAFYAHFQSKSQLYGAAIAQAAMQSRLAGDRPTHLSEKAWLLELLTSYLCKDTSAKTDWPCPLAFLATDVVRREPEVRAAYTASFAAMNTHIRELAQTYSNCSEATVLSVTAMLIGTVAIARTLDNERLRISLLESSVQTAVMQLGLA